MEEFFYDISPSNPVFLMQIALPEWIAYPFAESIIKK